MNAVRVLQRLLVRQQLIVKQVTADHQRLVAIAMGGLGTLERGLKKFLVILV